MFGLYCILRMEYGRRNKTAFRIQVQKGKKGTSRLVPYYTVEVAWLICVFRVGQTGRGEDDCLFGFSFSHDNGIIVM